MKVAVTAKGKTLQDMVDPRFGRATYILIVDTDSMVVEAIDNIANINALKGAGIQAATMIYDRGAEVLLTGFCGPNAFKTASAAGIKIVNDVSGSVEQAVSNFIAGQFEFSEAPNADGHW